MRKVLIGLMLLFGAAVAQAQTTVCFSPNDNCAYIVATEVNKTISTLDLALYSLTYDPIADIVIDAHKAGVRVRMLIDVGQAGSSRADDERLEDAGIELYRIRSTKGGLMHHKFAIMDGKALFTGSYNWTKGGNNKNNENLLLLHDQKIINKFQEEFDALWEHALKKWKHKQKKYRKRHSD